MKALEINYEVEFYSFWHCGSGLAAGAETDALVVRDNRTGLPFIPGKTIKGLILQAVREIHLFGGSQADISALFGSEGQDPSRLYFSNATLIDADEIIKDNLQSHLFTAVSNTALGDDGIAKDGSLRRTEIVIPCKLSGTISGIPTDEARNPIIQSLSYIKNIGLHRNRGLGRCSFVAKEG